MMSVVKNAKALVVVSLAMAAAISGCHRDEKRAAEAEVVAVEPPVPAPDGLLAEGTLATPQATWARVQRGVGGALGIMPSTIGGLVCALSGIDPTLGPEIDGVAPAYFVLAGDPASPSFAIAVKLVDPRRARIAFVESETATYAAHDVAGLTELTAKAGASPMALALTRGGLLVMSRTAADLEKLGPYAHRTLPSRLLPATAVQIDFPGAAIRGDIRGRIAAWWKSLEEEKLAQDAKLREQHGGRAPDFGDPRALMASLDVPMQARLAAIGDLKEARITVDATDDAVRADVTFTPGDGDGPARAMVNAIHTGDLAPILAAPIETPVAILARDDAKTRASDAADVEAGIVRTLGKRLSDADAKKLHTAIIDWSSGRGDWITASIMWNDPRGLVVRAAAANGEALARAVREGLELTNAPILHEPLKTMLGAGDVTFSSFDLPSDSVEKGKAQLAMATMHGGKLGAAWRVGANGLHLAFAQDPAALLARAPAHTLGDDPVIAKAIAPIASDASFVLVAQPSRFDVARASAPPSPVVFAWGKRAGAAWAHAEVADAVIRDFARSGMGL